MCQVVQTTEDALTTRVLQATIHTLELYGIYLGKELGLYEVKLQLAPEIESNIKVLVISQSDKK